MTKYNAAPDPMKPECALCGKQDTALVQCSTCEVPYCSGECFSTHPSPAGVTKEISNG